MNEPTAHRQIIPGPSSFKSEMASGDSPPGDSYRISMDSSKKRVSMACLAYQRRRVAAKRTADELSYHRDMLNDLLRVMRAEDQSYGLRLLDIIRRDANAEEMRGFIDDALAQMEGMDSAADVTVRKLEDVRRVINVEGAGPSFRPKVMDIHYLCDEVPFRVPAKPWTTVTEDSDLVSHLISLYFTWDFPFHVFLDRDVFLRDMAKGDLNSEFCSPFLVNALLANACHFSDYLEAYVDPGDIVTKGADFLAEAERLRDEEPAKLSLAFLQGTLLLYERYSIAGNNDLGYKMLHQAIWTGESLGLIGPKVFKLSSGQLTDDMNISIKRTAWGLFHIDTVVHTDFLRPSLIDKVNLERPDKARMDETTPWVPYPSHRAPRPSLLSQYFDESCNLCEIARDISRQLYAINGSSVSAYHQRRTKEALFERLRRWHQGLPDTFNPDRKPPPYVILLRMRYHTLTINLFSWRPEDDVSSVDSEAPKTPESPPGLTPSRSKFDALENILSSARAISALARLYRREYGMSRAHHFALYAINLALFTMLDHEDFDILDQDFLSLTSAFINLASRSQLGRNLFYLFRQSVLAKGQGQRASSSSVVNDELKSLFTEDLSSPSRWDGYDKGLEKLNGDERYRGIPGDGDHSLFDMLDCYESLSLGKDEIAPERYRPETR
ncbi:hypothetical protein BBP40_009357 [Aspergillus hancockii]|nr:hypothetical protein BBP40_009357 [Aspergillus hancockii]